MVRHPLEHGIGEQQIGARLRHPDREIAFDKCTARQPFAGLPQHIRRRVDPNDSALGNRSTKSAVELPGPQPRSTARRGDRTGTCAKRSRGGRVRSSSNLRYWLADQESAVWLLGLALAMRSLGVRRFLELVRRSGHDR
jgi:hypothetical protein